MNYLIIFDSSERVYAYNQSTILDACLYACIESNKLLLDISCVNRIGEKYPNQEFDA